MAVVVVVVTTGGLAAGKMSGVCKTVLLSTKLSPPPFLSFGMWIHLYR